MGELQEREPDRSDAVVAASATEVVVLQHVDVEGPGRIAAALEARGLRWRTVRAGVEPVPDDARRLEGLVVMGGPMAVYEADRHPFLTRELRLIERAMALDVPVLGVCLGSQLLAAALGARVHPGAEKEIGWFPVQLTDGVAADALFAGAPRRFDPLHWHGDVFELPRGATLLARSELTPTQAFRHGAAWGLLFHLEATADQVSRMAACFADELGAAHVDAAALVSRSAIVSRTVESIARDVFDRWAALVAARRRR